MSTCVDTHITIDGVDPTCRAALSQEPDVEYVAEQHTANVRRPPGGGPIGIEQAVDVGDRPSFAELADREDSEFRAWN